MGPVRVSAQPEPGVGIHWETQAAPTPGGLYFIFHLDIRSTVWIQVTMLSGLRNLKAFKKIKVLFHFYH